MQSILQAAGSPFVVRPAPPQSRAHAAFQRGVGGRLTAIAAATPSGGSSVSSAAAIKEQRAADDKQQWAEGAFPSYLQSEVDDFCAAWSDSIQAQDTEAARKQGKHLTLVTKDNPVWQAIRHQATQEAAQEMLLSSFYHASILSHDSFARSLAFVLANRLADATLLATELFEIFHQVLKDNETIKQAALLDIVAFYERDPACTTYSGALLYFKGYHAIQTHRIGHELWTGGRKVLALALQARISEVLAIDIHPGAVLGKGLLIDHGTGVVIGETSRIGDNVSIMQNVTLGGTGKTAGSRHPQVESNVLIGAGATVLGNITVGKGAQVAAGSLVLRDVPPRAMVAGSPANVIGQVSGNAALRMQQTIHTDSIPPPRQPRPAGSLTATLMDPYSGRSPAHSHHRHSKEQPQPRPPPGGGDGAGSDSSRPNSVSSASSGVNGSSPFDSSADGGADAANCDAETAGAVSGDSGGLQNLANWALSAAESQQSPPQHSPSSSSSSGGSGNKGAQSLPRQADPRPQHGSSEVGSSAMASSARTVHASSAPVAVNSSIGVANADARHSGSGGSELSRSGSGGRGLSRSGSGVSPSMLSRTSSGGSAGGASTTAVQLQRQPSATATLERQSTLPMPVLGAAELDAQWRLQEQRNAQRLVQSQQQDLYVLLRQQMASSSPPPSPRLAPYSPHRHPPAAVAAPQSDKSDQQPRVQPGLKEHRSQQPRRQQESSNIVPLSGLELQLTPDECEPDWLTASAGLPTSDSTHLADWALGVASRSPSGRAGQTGHSGGGSPATERGLRAWREMHAGSGSGDGLQFAEQRRRRSGSQAAALQRHNNRVLAEAGILNGAASWAIVSPFDVVAAEETVSSEPSAELLTGTRSGAAWAKPGAAIAAERIMVPPSTAAAASAGAPSASASSGGRLLGGTDSTGSARSVRSSVESFTSSPRTSQTSAATASRASAKAVAAHNEVATTSGASSDDNDLLLDYII
mmetsp:Transcript_15038/g.45426  ORF Transcript_15038/g.45426 Transcript_15038/m.45426 type:complete len:981 (-) Transcript_15038:599-3541(-)